MDVQRVNLSDKFFDNRGKFNDSKENFPNSQVKIPNNNREKLTDKFYSHTKNASDMSDVVLVPRTIFKGYLGLMAGTTMTALAQLAKNKKWLSVPLNVAGISTCMYGTWAFVRPYVLKDAPGVAHEKS